MNSKLKTQNMLLPYENKWVALSMDYSQIFTSGASLKSVETKLNKLKKKDAVLTYILPFDKYYSPSKKA